MILPRLESWYGISIKCPSELAGKYSFTFSIHDESLELLLDIISKSSPVAYRKKETALSCMRKLINNYVKLKSGIYEKQTNRIMRDSRNTG